MTMKKYYLIITLLMITSLAYGQTVIKLWPDGVPQSNGLSGPENVMEGGRIGNISDPEMLVFPAAEPNGLAIIMCPGGGYSYVAANRHGRMVPLPGHHFLCIEIPHAQRPR